MLGSIMDKRREVKRLSRFEKMSEVLKGYIQEWGENRREFINGALDAGITLTELGSHLMKFGVQLIIADCQNCINTNNCKEIKKIIDDRQQ